ncbi:hypothetical protein LCGC14_2578710, partial [marine sediment metagenome]
DAAHAIDAEYKEKKIGNISDLTTFSFHPVKNITTAEGGMVTTNNDDLYNKLLMFRTHGISRDTINRFGKSGDFHYDMKYLGFRYNLSELHSALGIHQLNKLESFQKRRREIVKIYNREFENIEEIEIPYVKKDVIHSWHLYVIQLDINNLKVDRDYIFKALREENIGVTVHYIPVHYHSYYQNKFGLKKGILPNVEWLYPKLLTIPIFPKMKDDDVYDVIKNIGVNVHYIPVHYHSYYQRNFGLKKGILPKVEWLFPRLLTIPLFPKMKDDDVYDVINALEKIIKYYRKN